MNLQVLRRFLAVAELGSLNKAASRLNISQPALSKNIQLLEERLGVELLVRGARGVRLTSFGEALLLRARLIESELHKLQAELGAIRDLAVGEVMAGVAPGPGFQSKVLPAATLRLAGGTGRVSVSYTMGTRDQLIPAMRRGDLDFAIARIERDDRTDDLVQEPLFVDRNAIVVRAGHPLQGRPVSGADLGDFPWLVQSESVPVEATLREIVHAAGAPFSRSIVRSDSTLFIKSTLMRGDFVAVVRHDAVRAEVAAGVLAELELHATGRERELLSSQVIGVIHRREAPLSFASQALIGAIRTECALAGYSAEPAVVGEDQGVPTVTTRRSAPSTHTIPRTRTRRTATEEFR